MSSRRPRRAAEAAQRPAEAAQRPHLVNVPRAKGLADAQLVDLGASALGACLPALAGGPHLATESAELTPRPRQRRDNPYSISEDTAKPQKPASYACHAEKRPARSRSHSAPVVTRRYLWDSGIYSAEHGAARWPLQASAGLSPAKPWHHEFRRHHSSSVISEALQVSVHPSRHPRAAMAHAVQLSSAMPALAGLRAPLCGNVRRSRSHTVTRAAGNTFGHNFRVTTFGESHGGGVGCVVDGVPPRLQITKARR